MKLIDKDKVVAEIEKKIKQYKNERNTIIKNTDNLKELSSRIIMCQEILSFLDTLEEKEVDLEKELSNLDKKIKDFVTTDEFEKDSLICGHYWAIAKHAFLLGLKAKRK